MGLELIETRIRSAIASRASSEAFLRLRRRRAALSRRLRGEPRVVHYFHQVDDPYSHLVVQKLDALRAAYDVAFEIHLVSRPAPEFQGNEERFTDWALRDAASIAEAYGATLEISGRPEPAAVAGANAALASALVTCVMRPESGPRMRRRDEKPSAETMPARGLSVQHCSHVPHASA